MYPSLYYLFQDIFGVEIGIFKLFQSFGFFVALSFVIGSYIWTSEIKRRTSLGQFKAQTKKTVKGKKAVFADFIPSILTGFVLGFKIGLLLTDYDGFINDPQGYLLSLQGNFYTGIAIASISYYMNYRDAKKEELPEPIEVDEEISPSTHVGNMVMIAALFGIIGAKLFHLIENPSQFATMFNSAGAFFSGLTMYGGLIVGGIATGWYAIKNKLNILHTLDSSAPVLLIGYGIGRIGCQIAGDGDWGIDNLTPQPNWLSFLPEWTWSFTYPHNVNNEGIRILDCIGPYCSQLPNPVWPTPFYETLMCFALFAIIWKLRTKFFAPGVLFSIYLVMNGAERFLIEKIRVNVEVLPGITQAEIISSILMILGAIGILFFRKNKDEYAAAW
ncbi:MAG: prolipoprotein diacylglyceryl transferase [Flavobacteriales bacterium]|nr:prolipoprotein diacylglyceryl transferase [Flavobacteriales bacterium]